MADQTTCDLPGQAVTESREPSRSLHIGKTGNIAESDSDRQSEGMGREQLIEMRYRDGCDPISNSDPEPSGAQLLNPVELLASTVAKGWFFSAPPDDNCG